MPGEVGVDAFVAATGTRRLRRQACVVTAALGVPLECFGVTADGERRRCAGDDDRADVVAVFEIGHHQAVLGVHRAGPGVVTMRPIQPDGRDPVDDLVTDGGEFGGHRAGPIIPTAP